MRDDPELDVIRKRGFQHEARYLADLARRRPDGRSRSTLDGSIEDRGDQLRAAAADDDRGDGRRAPTSSTRRRSSTARGAATPTSCCASTTPTGRRVWGPWHYEVADTKLARHVKASAVLQICSYIDQLERIQGVRPEWMHVALGGSARAVERLRVDDYMAYYRSARDRFLATLADETPAAYPPAATYPEPVEHCDVCRWAAECVARRRADDHLSLVAGISGRQRRALDGARRRDARGARRPGPADRRRRSRASARGALDAGPRAGADPARGPPRRTAAVRAAPARAGAADRARARPGVAAAAVARRPVLRHRGRPVRARRRARLPVRRPRRRRHVPRDLVARRRRRVHARRRAARLRAADRPVIAERLRARPGHARLPLRAVRADRAQAADGPLRHARGGGRSAAARRRARRPVPRRPPVAARVGRELLDQEAGAVLRVRARDRPARRRLEHRRLRGVARARRGRAAGGRPSRPDRALQPRRRRQQPRGCATGWRASASSSPTPTGRDRPAAGRARRRRCPPT